MATMAQAIREAIELAGRALTRDEIRQFVAERYPEQWQPATLTAHLYGCAINNPKAYIHHPNADRFLYKRGDGTFELYDAKLHGPNIWETPPDPPGPGENAELVEASISLERDIEDHLVSNLVTLEAGLTFLERQVTTDVGRIDILARGADGGLVVIEVKAGEAKDAAIGQLARYVGWYRSQGEAGVRGILVASDFPEGLLYAATAMPGLTLRRFKIQFSFETAAL